MKVLLIDFYDSFTYNIYHYLKACGATVTVCEDKQLDIDEVEQFDCIVLSPGPGLPKETQSMFAVLQNYSETKKILGICLGMQGISEYFGGELYNQQIVKHGVSERVSIKDSKKLFKGFPSEIKVGLYHSWAVDLSKTSELIPLAYSENDILMAVQHVRLPIYAVQFHPESILTEFGMELIENFLKEC